MGLHGGAGQGVGGWERLSEDCLPFTLHMLCPSFPRLAANIDSLCVATLQVAGREGGDGGRNVSHLAVAGCNHVPRDIHAV